MLLHPPTIFAVTCLLTLLLGGVQLFLWRQDRAQRALATVGSAYLIGACGMILLALRGAIPDLLSIDLANAVIVLGYGLIWVGTRQFERRSPRLGLAFLGAAVWLAAGRLPGFYENLAWRVFLVSAIAASYCTAAAIELLRGPVSRRLPSRRPLAVLLLANAVLHMARAPLLLVLDIPETGAALPSATPWFAFISLIAIVAVVGIAILLVALAKEQAEELSNATLAAARDASEAASREKSRFLARMSHELRTLLNSVLGMAQALAHDPALDAKRRERAAMLERAGRHLVAIVNDVLDLARVEAGRLELAPRPVELRNLLGEAIELVEPAATARSIALALNLRAPLPEAVLADPLRVRQILLNLLGNAVKFTPEGGRVTLSAQAGAGGLELAVTDTGPGIPAELRERLFQDYERMGADAAGQEGTGLGLAITAALARIMGGRVVYEPGPDGVGSRFVATLPLPAAARPPAAAPVVDIRPGMRRLRIFVIDDIAANRMVVTALLSPLGHEVVGFADAPAALAALAEGPLPDIVLMDVFMPGMDGFEATARIRALPGAAGRLPVLAVTAEASPEEVRACHAAGMDGHVAKPVDREGLLEAIATAVHSRV